MSVAETGPKPAMSEVIYRTVINVLEDNSFCIYVSIVELGDGHDYIFSQKKYDVEITTPVHAAGCRKCNPEPKPMICSKCNQRPENSLTLNR